MHRIVVATSNRGKVAEMRALWDALGGPRDADGGAELQWLDLEAVGVDQMPDEVGDTFFDNALIKAQAVVAATGLPAVADDSGLVVPALGGEPGVWSARYAGEGATDRENVEKLLQRARELMPQRCEAYFMCACVLVCPRESPLARALWNGESVPLFDGHEDGAVAPLATAALATAPLATAPVANVRGFAIGRTPPWAFGWYAEGRVHGVLAEPPRGANGFGYDPVFHFPPLGRRFAELTMAEKNAVSHRAQAFGGLVRWLHERLSGATASLYSRGDKLAT